MKTNTKNTKTGKSGYISEASLAFLLLVVCFGFAMLGHAIRVQCDDTYGCRPQIVKLIETAAKGDPNITFNLEFISVKGISQTPILMNEWEQRFRSRYMNSLEKQKSKANERETLKQIDKYLASPTSTPAASAEPLEKE